MQLCVKCKDLVKVLIFRSGVVFTPEVRMKHVDRHRKVYPARNKGDSLESEYGAENASDCLKEKGAAVNMDKSGNYVLRGSKTMKSNELLCGRGVPCKDLGLEKGSFLKPYLADYNYIS